MISTTLLYLAMEIHCASLFKYEHAKFFPFSMDTRVQQNTLVIQGVFNKSGDSLLELKKVVLYNRKLSRATPSITGGRYRAVVHYQNKKEAVVQFNALVSDDSGRKAVHGFFELQIPVHEGITSVRIFQVKPEKLFAEIKPESIQRE